MFERHGLPPRSPLALASISACSLVPVRSVRAWIADWNRIPGRSHETRSLRISSFRSPATLPGISDSRPGGLLVSRRFLECEGSVLCECRGMAAHTIAKWFELTHVSGRCKFLAMAQIRFGPSLTQRIALRLLAGSVVWQARDVLGPLGSCDAVACFRANVCGYLGWGGVPQPDEFVNAASCEDVPAGVEGVDVDGAGRAGQRGEELRLAGGREVP
jgi:hypothetical protein